MSVWKEVYTFAWGVWAGATVGYLINRKKTIDTINREVDDAVESVKEAFTKTQSEGFVTVDDLSSLAKKGIPAESLTEEVYIGMVEEYSETDDQRLAELSRKMKEELTKALDDVPSEEEVDVFEVEELDEAAEDEEAYSFSEPVTTAFDLDDEDITEPPEDDEPYVISVKEFLSDQEYKKVNLVYYSDDVLASEGGRVVRNIDSLIGDEALVRFGERSDDPDVVYVRNRAKGIDYEVTQFDGTYSRAVIGITDRKTKAKMRFREDE